MALTLSDLLRRMLEMAGSDLHITTNSRHKSASAATWFLSTCPR